MTTHLTRLLPLAMAAYIAIVTGFAQETPTAGTFPALRTVTDITGRKLEGTILSKNATAIKFRRTSDKKEVELPLAKLSPDDQTFIAGLAVPAPPPVKPRTALLLGGDSTKTQLENAGFIVTQAPTEARSEYRDGKPTPNPTSWKYTSLAKFSDDQIKSYDLIFSYSRGQVKTEERLIQLLPSYNGVVVWENRWDRTRELLFKNQNKKYNPYEKNPAYMKTDGNVVFYTSKTIKWNTKTDNDEILEEHPEMEGRAIAEARRLLDTLKP